MYPKNNASPPTVAVGSIYLIADGTVQTSGASVRVITAGGAWGAGGGTLAYDTTSGAITYTPTQAETNGDWFIVAVYKASCTAASVTVVTTASATAGKVVLSGETHTSAVIPTVTTVTNQLTAAAIATGVWQDATAGDFTTASSIGKSLYTSGAAPGASSGLAIVGSSMILADGAHGGVNTVLTFKQFVGSSATLPLFQLTTTSGHMFTLQSTTGHIIYAMTGNGNFLKVENDSTTGCINLYNEGGPAIYSTNGISAGTITGSLTGTVGGIAGTLQTLDAIWAKIQKWLRFVFRKDAAIVTDYATELAEINANGGSGAGAFANTTDSIEALRDRGDSAYITATGFSTHSAADVWSVATRVLTANTNLGLPASWPASWPANWSWSTHSAADVVTALGTGSTLTALATAANLTTLDTLADRIAVACIGNASGAGTGTEVFTYGGVTMTSTVDNDGNRTVVFS